jgi:Ca-activated chloride channel family protein
MSETQTRPAGLVIRDGSHAAVPLTGVAIAADITSLCARVVVSQRYVNRETTPIEAVYVFPLEEGAAVCGFEAIVDNTLVVGEVKERETAFEMYDDAMADGHGAFLLDEERPDVFQASVGNLPPGKEVLLRVTYVTELTADANGLRFAIPTTVAPRYAPAEDRAAVGRSDADALNPPLQWEVPYGLDISVKLTMPEAITRIESASHPISVETEGRTATITLSQRDAALDRDFVLTVATKSFEAPHAWVERLEDGASAIAVAFAPAFETGSHPADVVFLVDRSGSMDGTSIAEVRNALHLCLRSMIPGCRFNIVGFGSTYQPLFPESRPYDDASLREASAHVEAIQANLGGTEILPALTSILEQRAADGLPRQLVVLTDGQVTNTDAVIALARQHASTTRVFTFGIGAGASSHLVRGLARAGGGAAEFIAVGERIEPKVVRQVGRLLSPALTDVSLEWSGLDVTQAPSRVPPVFAGGRVLVYGFAHDSRAGTARLTANGPDGPVSFEVPIAPATTEGRPIATLAARARIRELEESPEWVATRGSRQRGRSDARVVREIIELATKYTLASRETSFVAIERRETPVTGEVQLRRVPIALTSGWGGVRRPPAPALLTATLAAPSAVFDQAIARSAVQMPRATAPWPPPTAPIDRRADIFESAPRRPGAPPAMHELVRMQRASGYWELDSEFARVLRLDPSDLFDRLRHAGIDSEDGARAWATALALVWLERHAAEFQDAWRFLADKARDWLQHISVTPGGVRAWMEMAADVLRHP